MKLLPFTKLHLPKLIHAAKRISTVGYLESTPENLIYLDVDDDYVHALFPLLPNKLLRKPNYFEENLIGAHISVIYPEENKMAREEDLEKEYHFTIQDLYSAELNSKQYFILMVESPSLVALRKKYGLGEQPAFKDHLIHLHITIGVL